MLESPSTTQEKSDLSSDKLKLFLVMISLSCDQYNTSLQSTCFGLLENKMQPDSEEKEMNSWTWIPALPCACH